MGDFLNILGEDLDIISEKFYHNNQRLPKEGTKYGVIKNILEFYNIWNSKECTLDEALTNPTENYYYVIHRNSDLYFLKDSLCLGDRLLNAVRNFKNINILFLNEQESISEESFMYLDNQIKLLNLNANQFYLINNNSEMENYKLKYNSTINTHTNSYLHIFYSKKLRNHEIEFIVDKKFLFMCHNKRIARHRYTFLLLLKKNNLLDLFDWSLIENFKFTRNDKEFFHLLLEDDEINKLYDDITYLEKIGEKRSFYENEIDVLNYDRIVEETFKNSYINIVTETYFNYGEIHITEKSLKPFYFYQLPIFLAKHNYVKSLRNKFNFDFFDDIIDHSYDDEIDNMKRLKMIVNEIIRINNNKELIIEFYKNNKNRFESNKQIVLDISSNKTDYDYYQNLIHKK
jgi:hypothetical protein